MNLESGYQCVRDFFISIQESLETWPDVFSQFSINLINSTTCSQCESVNEYETTQFYVEISLPPNNTKIKTFIENELNEDSIIEAFCQGCKDDAKKVKQTKIINCDEVKFFIVVLSRGTQTVEGFNFSTNKVSILDEINLR